jgi:hypothetical protein
MKGIKHLKQAVLVLIFLESYSSCLAQEGKLFSLDLSNSSFSEFVTTLESKSSYRFFYSSGFTDSIRVTLSVRNQPINSILDKVLLKLGLSYSIDAQENVFITRIRQIQTDLPVGFYDGKDISNKTINSAAYDFMGLEKNKATLLAEAKVYDIGIKTSQIKPGNAIITGYVKDIDSGEPITGAVVFTENPRIGVSTDAYGFYSITLSTGRHELVIKSVGMKTTTRQVMLYSDGKLEIETQQDVTQLKEVVVQSTSDLNVSGIQMGVEKLDIKTMKKMPSVLGEADVLRVALMLPGVQSVGEGTTGLNVRGGATNQNLILFNDGVIYNPTHLFGFFSAFNPDIVKSVELYKSGIPAEYGGRLSSVMDIVSREGNKKKFVASGGISPVTGRITLEGPIIKDKTSILLSGRSTYSDWLLKQLPSKTLQNSGGSFFDFNVIVNHEMNDKNNLSLSAYRSNDDFKLGSDTLYGYQNQNVVAKWKHEFSNKLYGVFTGGFSQYKFSMASDKNPLNSFDFKYSILQSNAKADYVYHPNSKHTLHFGGTAILYNLSPGEYRPKGSRSLVVPNVLENEQGLETAAYISDNLDINPRLSITYGLRFSAFQYLGAKKVYQYAAGASKEKSTQIDSLNYSAGSIIANYFGPEPRVSLKYTLSENSSVKFSYNRTRQYIQMLSNTTAIAPADTWKLSDGYIKPQIGDQVSVGLYKNLRSNTLEFSFEAYYKTIQHALDFKSGAALILNKQIETDVLDAKGKAYGIEILLKKTSGKLNGWISYTYSRSFVQTQGIFSSETINRGEYYPSNFDKPHALNVITNYKFSHRLNVSATFTYSTGRPITLPQAKYDIGGASRLFYGDRNQYRIPDYLRTDLSVNWEGNHKNKKLAHGSWSVSIYNLLGRANPYSIYFESKDGIVKGYKLSVFNQPIPTVTYNFRF